MQRELWSIVPEGVTGATARIACERNGTAETLRGMEEEGKKSCERVVLAEPNVILCGCTSGSFCEGLSWNRNFEKELADIAGVNAVSTSGAMIACLKENGVRKVDVVTPYVETTNERLRCYKIKLDEPLTATEGKCQCLKQSGRPGSRGSMRRSMAGSSRQWKTLASCRNRGIAGTNKHRQSKRISRTKAIRFFAP
jgi:hypothetical protein